MFNFNRDNFFSNSIKEDQTSIDYLNSIILNLQNEIIDLRNNVTNGLLLPKPSTPTITYPVDSTTSIVPIIISSSYNIINKDEHVETAIQISTNNDFNNIVYDNTTSSDSTTIQIDNTLNLSSVYYCRLRHNARVGG